MPAGTTMCSPPFFFDCAIAFLNAGRQSFFPSPLAPYFKMFTFFFGICAPVMTERMESLFAVS